MFSLEEDVREVEKFLALFFFPYKSGTFLYNPFFLFISSSSTSSEKCEKEIGLIGSRRMISREEAAKE